MKPLLLILAASLFQVNTLTQTGRKTKFSCTPCGSSCDKEVYKEGGSCTHCGMALVDASTIRFTNVAPAAICAYVKGHPKTVLLDVRTKEEFEGKANPDYGTLKGAINISIQELPQRLKELERYKNSEILVYCSHSHRSPQAAYLLGQNGFSKVKNLSGGMSVVKDASCKK